MFLLATGERGIGFHAVFGDKPLTWGEFEELSFYQQRILLAASEEGRKELRTSLDARNYDQFEAREAELERRMQTEVFDPERMTPEEVAAWVARYS